MIDDGTLIYHIETEQNIEAVELSKTISAIAHQYHQLLESDTGAEKTKPLLVESVSKGSIVINFTVDPAPYLIVAVAAMEQASTIVKLGEHIKWFFDKFGSNHKEALRKGQISVQDCQDAINIVRPTAKHGGSQTFNIVHNHIESAIINIGETEARAIENRAISTLASLQGSQTEVRRNVPLTWHQLNRDSLKQRGVSPDKGIIEELDVSPKPILFADETSSFKNHMIMEDDNPYRQVHFVDVEVCRISSKIVSYRVVGYHGSDELK